jgi:DNA (cytosine-5)-methyltransferase 1
MLTHLSLFTGIGGLDLAAEWAGFTTVGQCEFADYPTKVLEKHWPNVPRWKDVRELTGESFRERTGLETVDCISGGFPCQPHSLAGKRLASSDERDLWGELARVVCEIRPKWFVGENVAGLLSSENGRFFGRVLRDMAELGYRVGWCCFPAGLVGAQFARPRVFILAIRADSIDDCTVGFCERIKQTAQPCGMLGAVLQTKRQTYSGSGRGEIIRENWNYLATEPNVGRMAYGVPFRTHRHHALGNAVIPQQAYPIFQAIADIESG